MRRTANPHVAAPFCAPEFVRVYAVVVGATQESHGCEAAVEACQRPLAHPGVFVRFVARCEGVSGRVVLLKPSTQGREPRVGLPGGSARRVAVHVVIK